MVMDPARHEDKDYPSMGRCVTAMLYFKYLQDSSHLAPPFTRIRLTRLLAVMQESQLLFDIERPSELDNSKY